MLENLITKSIHDLIIHRRDDLYEEKSIAQYKLQSELASSGFSQPPGVFFAKLSKLHEELIRKIGDIILESVIEVLNAYNPDYYPNLADDIKQEVSVYLNKGLAEPEDYRRYGWSEPPHRNKEQERSYLEILIHSSLCRLNTKIDLYVAKIKSKERQKMQEKSIIINAPNNSGNINLGDNNTLTNTIEKLPVEYNELKVLLNQLQEIINNSSLLDSDKEEAIAETKALAEAVLQPEEQNSTIRKTLRHLKSWSDELEAVPEIATKWGKTIVEISSLFGF